MRRYASTPGCKPESILYCTRIENAGMFGNTHLEDSFVGYRCAVIAIDGATIAHVRELLADKRSDDAGNTAYVRYRTYLAMLREYTDRPAGCLE